MNVFKMLFLSTVSTFATLFHYAIGAEIHRSSCRRDAIFKLTDRDETLALNSGSILKTISGVRLPVCANKCTSTFHCRSFNYKSKQSSICQILDIDKSNASVTLENAVGWNHYEPIEMVCVFFWTNYLILLNMHSKTKILVERMMNRHLTLTRNLTQ